MQKPSENNLALCQIGLMAQLWSVSQKKYFLVIRTFLLFYFD